MSIRTAHKITLAIGLGSALAIAVAIIGVYGSRRLVSDANRVSHTRDVRSHLQAVSRHVNAAKGDVRAFLLTGDSSYLARKAVNVDSIEAIFARVRALTVDDAEQQSRLLAIGSLLDQRKASLDRTVALGSTPGSTQGSVASALAAGERLSVSVDSALAAADSAEAALLTSRASQEVASQRVVEAASAAIVVTTMALVALLWRSITTDLARRSQAEAELRASEAKYSGILAIAADAIVTIDEQQRIVHFNQGAEQTFGYSADEAIGRSLEFLLPERHRAQHGGHLHEFATGATAARRMGERRQIFGLRKNGEEFPADASISRLDTPRGPLFTAVLRDVTERARAEHEAHALAMAGDQLVRSAEYEETLIAVVGLPVPSIGIWSVLDVREECDAGPAAYRRLTSTHPDAAVDQALREWERRPLDEDSPEPAIDVFRTGTARRIDDVSPDWLESHVADLRDMSILRRMGANSLLVVPIRLRDRVAAVWTIGSSTSHRFDDRDATLAAMLAGRAAMAIENACSLLRARRATAARDNVLSVVSHDLRNPLAAVSMLAHHLADGAASADEAKVAGANILSSVDWMHKLMQDLLDVASIEAGRLLVEPEPQAIHQIVEVVTNMLDGQAVSRGVGLTVDLPPSLPLVFADPSRLVQLMANLVGNAIKFTQAGGTVTIGAKRCAKDVVVWVTDTGAGIPAADLPRIFDRFWNARRNSATKGNGLGLAIAQGIARAHGGRLMVESVVGTGSTFSFALPISNAEHPMSGKEGAKALHSPAVRG